MNIPKLSAVLLMVCSVLVSLSRAMPEELVRAKIGIQRKSGDRTIQAKARDRLKAGDLLRIYVLPKDDVYVYVVHTDRKRVTLLNQGQKVPQGASLVLPAPTEFYQIVGTQPQEIFTIICSPTELSELLTLFRSENPSYAQWASLEEDLLRKSRIDLGQQPEKPFAIAGNVRGLGNGEGIDPFLAQLRVYSGKSLLVRRYEFRVKK
ncbi:MAG: hypothetical protein D6736_15760 [Nitrospinota bacterium]|nr:MAG: hypothetical protein D6736_15760 [Nitrospinota bacterium]